MLFILCFILLPSHCLPDTICDAHLQEETKRNRSVRHCFDAFHPVIDAPVRIIDLHECKIVSNPGQPGGTAYCVGGCVGYVCFSKSWIDRYGSSKPASRTIDGRRNRFFALLIFVVLFLVY